MPESVTQGIGGTTLRLARLTRGLSQEQLAGMVGVSRQAVSAAESGRSDPSLRVALGLARALGLSVEDVFGRVRPPPLSAPGRWRRLAEPGLEGGHGPGGRHVRRPAAGRCRRHDGRVRASRRPG